MLEVILGFLTRVVLLGWYKAEFFGIWHFWVNFPTLGWAFLYFDGIWCFDFIFLLGWYWKLVFWAVSGFGV